MDRLILSKNGTIDNQLFLELKNNEKVSPAEIRTILKGHGLDCWVEPISGSKNDYFPFNTLPVTTIPSMDISDIDISVVVPIFNEEKNIPILYSRLTATLGKLPYRYEIILVDDGSRDASPRLMEQLYCQDSDHMRCIFLSRNFGHQPAISAGIKHAQGRGVIVMDADLQDPPEVLPKFIEKWQEGYQVVYAVREKRKEHFVKRAAYHTFYRILHNVSRIEIPLDTGDFGIMDRCVVDVLCQLPESNRFVRGLRSWTGFRQIGLAYERDARYAGTTKYTFRKLVNLALDGLISFSYLPLRLATYIGFLASAVSFLLGFYYLIRALTVGIGLTGFATTVILITLIGGVQLITIGIIGEYMGHILDEVKHRPNFIVRKALGCN